MIPSQEVRYMIKTFYETEEENVDTLGHGRVIGIASTGFTT